MNVHLVNPSHVSFGTSVITPRWLYVLAAATPASFGDPILTDETLTPVDSNRFRRGDVVGIGIHTGNACVAMKLADSHASAERMSSSAGFMRRFIRRKRKVVGGRMTL